MVQGVQRPREVSDMKRFLALVVAVLATAPAAQALPASQRGIWAEAHKVTDAELARIKELGYTFVFSNPSTTDLDRVDAAGLKAVIWLGGYRDGNDPAPTCVWRRDDATVTSEINGVK